MKISWRRSYVVSAIGLFYLVPLAGFGQSRSLTVEELTRRAAIAAVGKVTSMRSEWTSDKSRIITRVTVAVDQYLKGTRQDPTLTITVPGGEVEGVGEMYTHMAQFRNNEEVVVFAEQDASGGLRVTGGEQGKLTITTERTTGKRVVAENQLLEVFTTRVLSAASNGQ